MTKYVKTDYDGGTDITAGREYLVYEELGDTAGWINDDLNSRICIYYSCCPHLSNNPWTVINR